MMRGFDVETLRDRAVEMRRKIAALLAVCIGLGFVLTSCGGDDDADTKAAFVYVGPVGDAGWTTLMTRVESTLKARRV